MREGKEDWWQRGRGWGKGDGLMGKGGSKREGKEGKEGGQKGAEALAEGKNGCLAASPAAVRDCMANSARHPIWADES